MKIAVIGSRGLEVELERYIPNSVTCIISGGAKGIDSLAEEYAKLHSIDTIIFKPEYHKYGKRAPLVRNKKIVDYADIILAFWDGVSKGTKYTINYARKVGKEVKVILIFK